jgi:hypothetical protein
MGVEGCLNNGQRARMTRACGVRIFAVALVFLLFPPAPSALSSPLAPLHPLCLHSPRSSLLHLRGGHAASAEKPKGKPVFTKASGSGKAGKTAAGGPASDTAKEALYQLTTQLLGSGPPTGKKDLYEVLEVSKSASVKEIRDSYYKEPPPPPPLCRGASRVPGPTDLTVHHPVRCCSLHPHSYSTNTGLQMGDTQQVERSGAWC